MTKEILTWARESGVVADAIRAKRLRKLFRTDESVHTWLDEFRSSRHPPDPDCVTPSGPCNNEAKPPPFVRVLPQAPCVFEVLKWKSNETVADGLKWRDIVSFKNHPLQQWSKIISRCLQALVNFLCNLGCGLGFAKMQGVRDQVHAAQRMGAVPELTVFAEEDMADMFWEIPAEEVKQAARWAMQRMCANQRIKHALFSISRESKHLDQVGTSAAQSFLVVDEAAIMRFFDFDLDQNVLFTAGGVVLAQGGKGVPIGGFISAQAAELWAMWRERNLFDSASTGPAQEAWLSVVDNPPPCVE